MSNVIAFPIVAGVEINTDSEGRFNLNALHRASGGRDAKRPKAWLATKQAQELVEELRQDSALGQNVLSISKGGVSPGTFAHELLAISYAGWISPAFQLKVNQTFLDYKTGKLTPTAQPQLSTMEILQMAMDAEKERLRLEQENKQQQETIGCLNNLFKSGMTIPQFGKMLNGVNCMKISEYVFSDLGWLYNESRSGNSKRWRVKSTARDRYLTETDTEIGAHGASSFIKFEPRLLQKGAQKLYDLYLAGRLPMKKTWDGQYTHLKVGSGDVVLLKERPAA